MAEAPLVGYYNPNLRKQGAKTRRLASERSNRRTAEQDPRTYGFVSGLMGEDYGSSPISVLDPKRAKSQKAQDVGMAVGTALEVVPGLAAIRRPAVKASKAVGKSALKAVNDAHLYGDGFLGPFTPQVQNIVRTEKGGNWWPNNIQSQVTDDLKKSGGGRDAKAKSALNAWIDNKLGKYIQNEMGTPEDPIMKRFDSDKPSYVPIDQYIDESIMEIITDGSPKVSKTQRGKLWEGLVETFMSPAVTAEKTPPFFSEGNEEWLKTLPKGAKIHNISPNDPAFDGDINQVLGFDHLVDELYNATRNNSGLPRELIYTPEQLSKVTVDQAVERVTKINEWRAAQKVEANKDKAVNAATELFKEYPENNPKGLRWVELKPTGSGATYKDLEEALKYEGDVMGHCVGGYCDDVYDGKQRIFSLRDKTGQPHVTIEMKPASTEKIKDIKAGTVKNWEIFQVKGKGNGKPAETYIPYVQDFVKETGVNIKYDLKNTDLQPIEWAGADPRMLEAAKQKFGKYAPPKEFTEFAEQWKPSPYTQEVLPAAEREANLQKMQEESGAPGDWFHGTSRDIKQFEPKQAGASFFSRDPNFVEDFAYNSNAWMGENVREFLTPEQIEAAKPKAVQLMKNRYGSQNRPHQKSIESEISNEGKGGLHASGEALDYLTESYKDMMPSGPNIMKVHLGVKKPWDYENPEHVADLLDEVNGDPRFTNLTADQLSKGSWGRIEGPDIQEAIRNLGYDAFYMNENGVKNIGVYDPAKIKSAIGNVGTYDLDNPEINKKAGGSVRVSRYSKQR